MTRCFASLCLVALMQMAAANESLPLPAQSALKLRSIPLSATSVQVLDLQSGDVIVKWNAATPRNPASTIKLLTTLSALDQLGPTYRWRTEVYALGEIRAGILHGDLLVKGYGDPFLVTERVWQLVQDIRREGIVEIRGDLVIDDSWFDVGEHDPAAFDNQPLRAYNVAPSAMLTNFKVVRYWFEPAGANVAVRMEPPLKNVKINNRLRSVSGSCRGYQRGIAISMNQVLDTVTFSGQFPNGCKRYAMDRTALSHNAFTYGLFESLWRSAGGKLAGNWRNGVIDESAEPLLTFYSQPLHDIISRVNKHSNNVMTRQLVYTLAAEKQGAPGTEAAGIEIMHDWLVEKGLKSCCTAISNGAGLSRNVRITAEDMSALLHFAWRQPYMPEFLSSLSLAGLDGTLRRRFSFDGLTGQAHMKTGSLDHVSALAGYLQARDGRRYVVVSFVNHKDVHRGPGDEFHEALLRWLYER